MYINTSHCIYTYTDIESCIITDTSTSGLHLLCFSDLMGDGYGDGGGAA